ncbi:hypothetical protein Q7P37_010893 [Cladosporium fusiforme]
MSYDEHMAQMFPAVLSAGAETASQRTPFQVARRFQDVSESHCAAATAALLKSRVATSIDANRRRSADASQTESGSVYIPMTRKGEIRVLEILPGMSQQPLYGSLHHVTFEDGECPLDNRKCGRNFTVSVSNAAIVCYTALSYVWGSSVLECTVDIGEISLGITRSLDTAIRHLRHEKESVIVWIDQICINQSDLAEKTAQVQLMSLIYERAWNTVIWLGDFAADDAFDALQELQNITINASGPLLDEEKERMCNPPYMVPGGFKAIERFFSAPWFQRTWTIQEAVLSGELWVIAGSSTRHWEDSVGCAADNQRLGLFQPVPTHAENLDTTKATPDDVTPVRLHGVLAANAIWSFRQYYHSSLQRYPLIQALVDTRHTQATNPLDNVYGILGLCRNVIIPDYTLDATELWRRVSLQILKAEIQDYTLAQACRLLCCVDHDMDDSVDVPSWAVDWSKPRVTTSLAFSTSAVSCFDAGKSSTTTGVFRVHECESVLCLNAKMFDTIHHLSPILEDADLEAAVSGTDNMALRTCIAHATSAPPDLLTKLSFLGFCMLLTAGKDSSGMQKYLAGYTEILSFLSDAVTQNSPTFPDQIYTPRQRKGRLTLENLKTRSCGKLFQDLRAAFKSAVFNRRLCWTKKGHLGLVPRFAKQGDCVAVVPGSPVPFVIRRAGERKGRLLHRLVGESYIDGIMHVVEAASACEPPPISSEPGVVFKALCASPPRSNNSRSRAERTIDLRYTFLATAPSRAEAV